MATAHESRSKWQANQVCIHQVHSDKHIEVMRAKPHCEEGKQCGAGGNFEKSVDEEGRQLQHMVGVCAGSQVVHFHAEVRQRCSNQGGHNAQAQPGIKPLVMMPTEDVWTPASDSHIDLQDVDAQSQEAAVRQAHAPAVPLPSMQMYTKQGIKAFSVEGSVSCNLVCA